MERDIHDFFESINDEFLRFDRVENKLNSRPDLHAFLLLHALVPDSMDMVAAADNDEIYLSVDPERVNAYATDAQLIDLHRCGVVYHKYTDSFAMFV